MLLYHGTNERAARSIASQGVLLSKGKKRVDFGRGFYLTPSFETARAMAFRKSLSDIPFVLAFDFDETEAQKRGWIREFTDCGLQWAQFILNNRCGPSYFSKMENQENNLSQQYPVVKGQIADGNISRISQELKQQMLPATAAVAVAMTEKHFPVQYSLHTPAALSLLRLVQVKEIR